ncbi:MAG: radical SAM protein [Chitinivibrionia bacterium]|nr:radical SAM protein [Chitinivibrionia bacterium]
MKNRRFKKIYLEITTDCNKNCVFCGKTSRKTEYLSVEKFENRLKQIANLGERIYLYVAGEPLLHPKLKDFLQIAENLGVEIAITTNATLIDEQISAILSPALKELNISVHSDSANNLSELEKIVKSGLNLSKMRQDLQISFRLWNIEEKENFHYSKTVEILSQEIPEFEIIPHNLRENKRQKIKENLFLHFDSPFVWEKNETPSEKGFCYGLQSHFAILTDGSVTPCCICKNAEIILGNIDEKDISQILASPRTKAIVGGFSKKIMVEEVCKKCAYARQKFAQKVQ